MLLRLLLAPPPLRLPLAPSSSTRGRLAELLRHATADSHSASTSCVGVEGTFASPCGGGAPLGASVCRSAWRGGASVHRLASRGGARPPRAACGVTEAAEALGHKEEATARLGHILSWASSRSSACGIPQWVQSALSVDGPASARRRTTTADQSRERQCGTRAAAGWTASGGMRPRASRAAGRAPRAASRSSRRAVRQIPERSPR